MMLFLRSLIILLAISYGCADDEFMLGESGRQYTVEIFLTTHVAIKCETNAIHVEELPHSVVNEISFITILDCELPKESLQAVVEALGARNPGPEISFTGVPLIRRQDLALKTFEKLYIWNSGVASDAFELQSQIEAIYLQISNINFTETSFNGLTKLETLSLQDCRITQLPQSLFNDTSQLKYLKLQKNLIADLTDLNFESLRSLEELDLSDNLLTLLPDNFLHSLPSIRELYLNKNPLRELTTNALRGSSLVTLGINDNTIPLTLAPRALAEMSRLVNVELTNCTITSLPGDLLDGSNSVEKIDLNINHIQDIPRNFFESKGSLHDLRINKNKLSVLSPRTFEHLTHLATLELDYNAVSVIVAGTFSFMAKLRDLWMRNNGLRVVSPAALPSSLVYLHLDNNKLTTLETRHMPALRRLSLNNNSFSSLPPFWRNTFPALAYIELMDNKFTRLKESDFGAVPRCVSLDLQGNSIVTVHIGRNTSLPTELYLTRSPLRCDCHVHAFARLYSGNKAGAYAICAEPPALNGSVLTDVVDGLICHMEACPHTCTCVVRPATGALDVKCREQLTPEQLTELDYLRRQHYGDVAHKTTVTYI